MRRVIGDSQILNDRSIISKIMIRKWMVVELRTANQELDVCNHRNGPFKRYAKLRAAHAPLCRERFPRYQLQGQPLVSDPGMHHGTCATHVPWCMSGSLTRGGGGNVPGIPVACVTRNSAYLLRGPWLKFGIVYMQKACTRRVASISIRSDGLLAQIVQRFMFGYLKINSVYETSHRPHRNITTCNKTFL